MTTSIRKRVSWFGDRTTRIPKHRGLHPSGTPTEMPEDDANDLIRDYPSHLVVADPITLVAEHIGEEVDRKEFYDAGYRSYGTQPVKWKGPAVTSVTPTASPATSPTIVWDAMPARFAPQSYQLYRGTAAAPKTTLVGSTTLLTLSEAPPAQGTYIYSVTYTDPHGYESDVGTSVSHYSSP